MKLTTTKPQTDKLLSLGFPKPKCRNYTIGELFAIMPDIYWVMQTQEQMDGKKLYAIMTLYAGYRYESADEELVNALFIFIVKLKEAEV